MISNIKRKTIPAILWPVLVSMPAKTGVVAVTFHNIFPKNFLWFDLVCRVITENYKVIDPYDFQRVQSTLGGSDLEVMFTFDDGFSSNIKVAKEILSKYGIRGLFFITEDFIDKNIDDSYLFALDRFFPARTTLPNPKHQYAAMSWGNVDWLLDQGHSIGAHTRTHPNLRHIQDEDMIREEIVVSANRIEDRLGIDLISFAYPFGTLSSISKSAIVNAMHRFAYGFSNVRGVVDESPSNHFIYRQNLVPNDPIWLVRAMIEGRLDWKYKDERNQAKQLVRHLGE